MFNMSEIGDFIMRQSEEKGGDDHNDHSSHSEHSMMSMTVRSYGLLPCIHCTIKHVNFKLGKLVPRFRHQCSYRI